MPALMVKHVIAAAINAERTAETLFRRLQVACLDAPEMAQFWGRFAEDEAAHAAWLTGLRARLSRDAIELPVDAEVAQLVHSAEAFSLERALRQVHTLEDAYRLAETLEHAETNAIFRFLAANFEPDAGMQQFLQSQIDGHVAALIDHLPAAYQTPEAQRVVVLCFD